MKVKVTQGPDKGETRDMCTQQALNAIVDGWAEPEDPQHPALERIQPKPVEDLRVAGMPTFEMFTSGPWHAAGGDVHHNNLACMLGNNIEPENRRAGTGDKDLCAECARLIENPEPPATPAATPMPELEERPRRRR